MDDVTEVGGNNNRGSSTAESADSVIGGLEGILDLGTEIKDENGLVDLDGVSAGGLESLEKLNIDREELVQE